MDKIVPDSQTQMDDNISKEEANKLSDPKMETAQDAKMYSAQNSAHPAGYGESRHKHRRKDKAGQDNTFYTGL